MQYQISTITYSIYSSLTSATIFPSLHLYSNFSTYGKNIRFGHCAGLNCRQQYQPSKCLPSLGLGHCRPRTETQGCCHSSDRVGRDHPLLEEPPQLKKKTANLHSLQSPIYFLNFVVLALSPPYLRAMPNPESPRFISTTFFLRVLWFQSLYLDISFSLVNFCKCQDVVVQLNYFISGTPFVLAPFVEKIIFSRWIVSSPLLKRN